jgi:dTDP-4-dehydrorhamnose 3,5-epimerase
MSQVPRLVTSEAIWGLVVVELVPHRDDRGRFVETYRREWFEGQPTKEMVQASRSDKTAGSLVGLHYHLHQSDYWQVMAGAARVVLHDLRVGSPTEGATLHLDVDDSDPPIGILIPPGVGHGFSALTDMTLYYLVDHYYNPKDELGVAYDDPEIAADWGLEDPVVSARDRSNPTRSEIPKALMPLFNDAS